ncbi:MAG: SDR family NAD(P)-dependent oxidoreductase, partial [Nitrospira sp.]|nr:SDR family NAD(P)-dependent oxidoreductase [Nitrospira sp.]
AAVVINYAKSAEKAKAIVASIEAKGGRALAIQADVSQVTDIQRLFQATLKQFDRIDIVIANAGMFNQKPL